jgi:hypothetical protein
MRYRRTWTSTLDAGRVVTRPSWLTTEGDIMITNLTPDLSTLAADGSSALAVLASQGVMAVSIAQLAAASSFGRTFLYAQIKAGKLRARKHGRRTIILVEDARNWLRGETASDRAAR